MFCGAHSRSITKNVGRHGYARTFAAGLSAFYMYTIWTVDVSVGHLDVASMMCAREARKWRRGYMFVLGLQT